MGNALLLPAAAEQAAHCVPCSLAQVHGFRLHLWHEHTSQFQRPFLEPQSLECSRLMRRIAMDNWADYVADEVVDMKGHLMSYPIQVRAWCLAMSVPCRQRLKGTCCTADMKGQLISCVSLRSVAGPCFLWLPSPSNLS